MNGFDRSTRIRRAFVTVGNRQVHLRYAGSGPAVVLIGQSPTSSQTLDRQTLAFAEHFTAIAIDTAGLGRSTALNTPAPEVADQAIALVDLLDRLGIRKAGLYGSHTGASICLEFARRYPDRTAIALLEGLPIYSDLERSLRLSTYFPAYSATWDGLHLMWLWYRYREQNIFWPWNIRGKGMRGNCDVPSAEHLHKGVVDILEVGMGYVPPYAAVFRYRAEEAIPQLSAPVAFLAYPDDSLLPALRHLPALPACCRIENMPLDRDAGVQQEIAILKSAAFWGDAPALPQAERCSVGVTRDYIDLPSGQLAIRRIGSGDRRPILLFPPAPGSVTQLSTLPELLARDREVIAIDLPGCGDSDAMAGGEVTMETLVSVMSEAVSELSGASSDIYAKDGGATVAAALSERRPDLVRRIVLDNPPALSDVERSEVAPRYAEPIELSWDGSYLIRLWHATRDQELYWPWYDRRREAIRDNDPEIDPERLTIEVHAYLKNHESYAGTWRTVLSHPTWESLSAVRSDILVCGSRDGKFVRQARRAVGDALHNLPTSDFDKAATLLRLFDRA